MSAVVRLFIAAAVMAQAPEEFFGKPEKLPLSGPIIGKNLRIDSGPCRPVGLGQCTN